MNILKIPLPPPPPPHCWLSPFSLILPSPFSLPPSPFSLTLPNSDPLPHTWYYAHIRQPQAQLSARGVVRTRRWIRGKHSGQAGQSPWLSGKEFAYNAGDAGDVGSVEQLSPGARTPWSLCSAREKPPQGKPLQGRDTTTRTHLQQWRPSTAKK